MGYRSVAERISENLNESFLSRPRLVKKIAEACQRSEILVIAAGAGYGKTSAAMDFLSGRNDSVIWIQLTENENIPAIFWNTWFSVMVEHDASLYKYIRNFEFPDTNQKFIEYWEAIADYGLPDKERYFVIDDLHTITNHDVSLFIARSLKRLSRYAHIIFLTRRIPDWMPDKYTLVSDVDLRATEAETRALFSLRHVNVSESFIHEIWQSTEGWIFALNMVTLRLNKHDRVDERVLQSMLPNLFNYFEQQVLARLSERDIRILHTINITGRVPQSYFSDYQIDKNSLLRGFLHLNVQRDTIDLHPLISEYLRAHPLPFTDLELRHEYRRLAQWCGRHHLRMLSVRYFAAAADYKSLVDNGTNEPLFIPTRRAEFYEDLIKKLMPDDNDIDYFLIRYIFYPRVLLSLRRFVEAETEVNVALQRFSGTQSSVGLRIMASNYASLAFLHLHVCPKTHRYDFDEYAQEAIQCYARSGISEPIYFGQFNNAPIRSYNCLVGQNPQPGEFQTFLAAVRQMVADVQVVFRGMYAGYDLLCEGEYYFRKGDITRASEQLTRAITTAKTGRQYAIMAYALHLNLRVCVCNGDIDGIKLVLTMFNSLMQNEEFVERNYYVHLMQDWLYIQTGVFDKLPVWMKVNTNAQEKYYWIEERDNWSQARYYLKNNEPEKVLTMPYITGEVDPFEDTCLGKIDRSIVWALALFKSGRLDDAFAALGDCYQLMLVEDFSMSFIEFGQDMADFCASYLKHMDTVSGAKDAIPSAWLKDIRAHSVVYAKRLAYVTGALFRKNDDSGSALTPREKTILQALYQGHSREEIADNLHVSLNTVKTNMANLFAKTGAKNSLDAVRYGLEKGILK